MKNFEEIKKDLKETKAKVKIFVTEHEEQLKCGACFIGGLALSAFVSHKYHDLEGLETKTDIVQWNNEEVGYVTCTFNKNGSERKGVRECVSFNSYEAANKIAMDILCATGEIENVRKRIEMSVEQKAMEVASKYVSTHDES